MIANKNQLKKALKERKDTIKFKTIYNYAKEGYQVGVLRNVGSKIQTNAFTIETQKDNGDIVDSWTWYDSIEVENNIITYKGNDIQIEIVEII